MKRDVVLDTLAVLGSVVTSLSFIEKTFFQENKIIFLTLGILILGVYLKLYVEDKAISRIRFVEKRLNSNLYKLNEKMNKQDKKISKIKGWVEAVNFFKDKKGAIDPITLFIILAIVIIIILALQGKL